MTRTPLVLLSGVLLALANPVRAEPTPARSAACVAALKARAEPLAQRLRNGDNAVEPTLMPIVTASFAFIGSAYKQGLRDREADELLRKAEDAQTKVPPAELARTQDACQREGQQLLADANVFERQFVLHAARRRVDRLRKPAGS
ncbi:MAG: hypothetical protein ACJ8G7_19750 [Rhizobacter sp.]